MDKVITIVNQKPSEFDFELEVDGLTPKGMKVRFCLKAKEYHLMFEAKHSKGDTWSVKLPALPMLEKGAFPYKIEVIADGYHFEAGKGTANITGSFDVYVKKPGKVEPGKEEKKPPKKVKEEKGVWDEAEKILAEFKNEEGSRSVETTKKDKKDAAAIVRQIIAETTSPKAPKRKTIFKKGKIIQH